MRTSRALLAAVAASILILTGCASGDRAPGAATEPAASVGPEPTGELTVFAAASLGAAFDDIAAAFETAHPSLTVVPIRYDGSSTLATQIIEGAPVDVFASADEKNMAKVTDEGLAADPARFASNTLVVATPAGNPAGITTLADLADPGATVVLCAVEVPCGAAAATLLEQQGVIVSPASLEQNVTAVLTKVANDEADAGLVYATDVEGAADVESFVPEGADEVVNHYPVVALTGAANPEAAAAFVAFVLSDEGQSILAEYGFGAP
ncbi:molybdate ABC transporter substrate-binding protein [Microbacterium sp.]|uniref:molybdate ABC transporter substrate-binding protein n=1 Tax=Microbacterium sp. TaxID=51671 RepID=UPI003F72C82E